MRTVAIFPDPWLIVKYSNPVLSFSAKGIINNRWNVMPTPDRLGEPGAMWLIRKS